MILKIRDSNGNVQEVLALRGEKGEKGADGTMTFADLTEEQKASLKGDKGDTGAAGTSATVSKVSESTADGGSNVVTFSDGKTLTVKNGSKGSAGTNGTNGKDGVSATHSWNGTTLTVTSASGTSSANLKGDKGDKGDTYVLTDADKQAIAAIAKGLLTTETWTFTLEDGSTVTKTVVLK